MLIVEDDPNVGDVVMRYLERAGLEVDLVTDGSVALAALLSTPPDLVVLDVMLPGMDGLEVCRRLRATSPVPVIMLTALGEAEDRIAGLEIGADDYMTKPFSPQELVLRVQSVLRRAQGPLAPAGRSLLRDGDLVVDLAAHEVLVRGQAQPLTAREHDLLVHLMRNPRRAMTREELLRDVWGWEFGDHSTVTVHIRRLREKVETEPSAPRRIVTVFGIGYRFEPLEEP